MRRRRPVLDGVIGSGRMDAAVRLWMRMYTGDAPWLGDGVVGMNLAAFVAGEVARLATVEMESRVAACGTGSGLRAKVLDEAYQRVIGDARVFVEYAAAGGTLAIKPYVEAGRLCVQTVKAGQFFPTAVDARGRVTGCLFVERAAVGEDAYVRVEAHRLEAEGTYTVENRAFRLGRGGKAEGVLAGLGLEGVPVPLGAVPAWAGLAEALTLKGVRAPLFALLRMPSANTVDPESPLGVSCYGRAVALMEEADKQFSRLLWEMESGERALYVDMRAFRPEDAEAGRLPFQRFYRLMDVDPSCGTLFEDWTPQLRERNQIAALNEILQRVEDACGLARGTLSEAPESSARGARTATELKIMRQRTYAMVRETQAALERALRETLAAMDVWATVYGLCPPGEWAVSFAFDDSVVSDRSEAFAERTRLVEMGAMAAWELRAWYLGEEEEIARRAVDGGA